MGIKTANPFLVRLISIIFLFMFHYQLVKAQKDSIGSHRNIISTDPALQQYNNYISFKNMPGLPDVATQNGYPTAQKALTWQKELQLNDRQVAAIGLIGKELQRKTIEMNKFLITNERAMDSLFRLKKINNGLLIFYTNRYGLYQGELRNALLQACLKTAFELTDAQIKKYHGLLQH